MLHTGAPSPDANGARTGKTGARKRGGEQNCIAKKHTHSMMEADDIIPFLPTLSHGGTSGGGKQMQRNEPHREQVSMTLLADRSDKRMHMHREMPGSCVCEELEMEEIAMLQLSSGESLQSARERLLSFNTPVEDESIISSELLEIITSSSCAVAFVG